MRCSIDDDVCISGQKSYKALIAWKYGVKIEEENKMTWSNTNLETVYLSLGFINDKLGGNLKSKIAGTTFTITDGGDQYYGWTSDKNSVYFHVASNSTSVPAINFIHETGHILDFRKESAYSNSINGDPNWTADGFVDSSILLGNVDEQIQALPNEAYDSGEYWADAFANYILDNIKLSEEAGNAMRNFVKYTLNPQPPPANYNRGWNET